MNQVKKNKAVLVKNRYNGEILECPDIKFTSDFDGKTFVQVRDNRDPSRLYWVNRDAYEIVHK